MSNLLHYFLITSLQTWNKTLARWLGKGGSANKKRTTFIVKYKVSKSLVWIETPRCWVADTEDLWAAHGPFYCCLTSLQLDMTPADKEGCQSVLFLDIIRSRIHSSATGKYSAIKGYDGNPESRQSFITQTEIPRHLFFVPGELLRVNTVSCAH